MRDLDLAPALGDEPLADEPRDDAIERPGPRQQGAPRVGRDPLGDRVPMKRPAREGQQHVKLEQAHAHIPPLPSNTPTEYMTLVGAERLPGPRGLQARLPG